MAAATSHHGRGVYNFLTNSWTDAQTASPRPSSPALTETESAATAVTVEPGRVPPVETASINITNGQQAKPTLPDPATLNPLVAAYADSLALRGFSPDNQGFIVTTLKGEVLAEHNADRLFNPASVTKVATSLTAISRLGPEFRFRTSLYTNGTLDPSTGVLHGSLYVIGSGDPAFFYENAMMIADKLNRAGIREVDGNLVVLGPFYFNFSTSRETSARAFRNALTPETWNAAARSAFSRFLSMRAAEDRASQAAQAQGSQPGARPGLSLAQPSLKITGETVTDPVVNTSSLTPLAVHTSLPLVRVLKGLNDFSNNWMATVIGNLVGGPDAVERFLKTEVGFKDDEVSFATPSGLGSNLISPRGTIVMLRKLISYLESKGLGLEDILPIAGMDGGTLERRFTDAYRGAVVAKTGTLSGVSALAGVAHTRLRGPVLFVIYNRGGSPHTFRAVQDETMKKIITMFGGPVSVRYTQTTGPRVSESAAQQAPPVSQR